MEKTNDQKDTRLSWDQYHMKNAIGVAQRASCQKGVKVGAVIVKNKRQISTGYNGSPPGQPTCLEVGCEIIQEMGSSCQRVQHAEKNAILQDSRACNNSAIYVTHFPCIKCMQDIVSVNISRVVYWQEYTPKHYIERHKRSVEIAERSGVKLIKLSQKDMVAIMKALKDETEAIEKLVKSEEELQENF